MTTASTAPFHKLLYSMQEAEAQSCMCRAMLYRYLRDGKLKAVKSGRRTLIKAEDLKAFIDALPKYEAA